VWKAASGGTIGRARLDGTEVDQSFILGRNPAGLAIAGDYLYWSNPFGGGTIGRARLDGTDVNQAFIAGASTPQGVAVGP
jgi:hypothetical protein